MFINDYSAILTSQQEYLQMLPSLLSIEWSELSILYE